MGIDFIQSQIWMSAMTQGDPRVLSFVKISWVATTAHVMLAMSWIRMDTTAQM